MADFRILERITVTSQDPPELACPSCGTRIQFNAESRKRFPQCDSCRRHVARVTFDGAEIWFDISRLIRAHSFRGRIVHCSLEEAQSALRRSALVPEEILEAAVKEYGVATSGERLLALLVSLGHITRYQAESLSSGGVTFDLGQYRILDSIARGASCDLFVGEHRFLGRRRAIKVATAPDAQRRLEKEASLFRDLRHQLITECDTVERDRGVTFLAREFVPGAALRPRPGYAPQLPVAVSLAIFLKAMAIFEFLSCRVAILKRSAWIDQLIISPDGGIRFVSTSKCAALRPGEIENDTKRCEESRDSINCIARECLAMSSASESLPSLREIPPVNTMNDLNEAIDVIKQDASNFLQNILRVA